MKTKHRTSKPAITFYKIRDMLMFLVDNRHNDVDILVELNPDEELIHVFQSDILKPEEVLTIMAAYWTENKDLILISKIENGKVKIQIPGSQVIGNQTLTMTFPTHYLHYLGITNLK